MSGILVLDSVFQWFKKNWQYLLAVSFIVVTILYARSL